MTDPATILVLQLVAIFAASADFSWGRPSACGGLSGRLFWLRLRCSGGQASTPVRMGLRPTNSDEDQVGGRAILPAAGFQPALSSAPMFNKLRWFSTVQRVSRPALRTTNP